MAITSIAASAQVLAAGHSLDLTPDEALRVEALGRPQDRDDFVAARVLARQLVGEHLGVAAETVEIRQVCERCGGPHGRPRVVGPDAHVSWAHSAGVVAVAVDDARCAIDLEMVDRARPLTLDVLTAGEQIWLAEQPDQPIAFARLWVRKEVLVKLGDVALDRVGDVDVTPSLTGALVLGRSLVEVETGAYDAVAAWAAGSGSSGQSTKELGGR